MRKKEKEIFAHLNKDEVTFIRLANYILYFIIVYKPYLCLKYLNPRYIYIKYKINTHEKGRDFINKTWKYQLKSDESRIIATDEFVLELCFNLHIKQTQISLTK